MDIHSPLCWVEGKSPSTRRIREALPPADRTDTYVHVFDSAALSWCDKRQVRFQAERRSVARLNFGKGLCQLDPKRSTDAQNLG
jgi:hypothetical protein